ncbi:MAG: hypothetical protein ACFB4I_16895 [Cyanophyceae cyanobacterium]
MNKLTAQRRSSKLSSWGSWLALVLLFGFACYLGIQSRSQQSTPVRQSAADCLPSSSSREQQIAELRQRQQQGDSAQCQPLLDQLLFGHAIETLASNNQRQEAVFLICEVSDAYYQANANLPLYFRRWSESSDRFQTWLTLYLQTNTCPAARYLK